MAPASDGDVCSAAETTVASGPVTAAARDGRSTVETTDATGWVIPPTGEVWDTADTTAAAGATCSRTSVAAVMTFDGASARVGSSAPVRAKGMPNRKEMVVGGGIDMLTESWCNDDWTTGPSWDIPMTVINRMIAGPKALMGKGGGNVVVGRARTTIS